MLVNAIAASVSKSPQIHIAGNEEVNVSFNFFLFELRMVHSNNMAFRMALNMELLMIYAVGSTVFNQSDLNKLVITTLETLSSIADTANRVSVPRSHPDKRVVHLTDNMKTIRPTGQPSQEKH